MPRSSRHAVVIWPLDDRCIHERSTSRPWSNGKTGTINRPMRGTDVKPARNFRRSWKFPKRPLLQPMVATARYCAAFVSYYAVLRADVRRSHVRGLCARFLHHAPRLVRLLSAVRCLCGCHAGTLRVLCGATVTCAVTHTPCGPRPSSHTDSSRGTQRPACASRYSACCSCCRCTDPTILLGARQPSLPEVQYPSTLRR